MDVRKYSYRCVFWGWDSKKKSSVRGEFVVCCHSFDEAEKITTEEAHRAWPHLREFHVIRIEKIVDILYLSFKLSKEVEGA